MENKKYHYFYKITNLINNHFYYGIHSTYNLDDGYMGSGTRLHYAYKKYGMKNFKKEILKFFDTRKEAAEYEAEIVTEELVVDINCYNIIPGGETWNLSNLVIAKDKCGNKHIVSINDPKYLSGEYVGITKGKVHVKDINGNSLLVSVNDPKYLSGEYVGITKGTLTVKDSNNNFFNVPLNDPRYLSGELKPIWSGRKHKLKTIQKYKETYKRIKHQQGEKNSQYGTCWIHNNIENKKIKKEELENYINSGWIKGRKMKF